MVRLHPSSRGRSRVAGNSLSKNRLHKTSGAAERAYFTRLLIWRTWFDSRLWPKGRCGVLVAHSVACSTIAPIKIRRLMDRGYFAHHFLKAGITPSPRPRPKGRQVGRVSVIGSTPAQAGGRGSNPHDGIALAAIACIWVHRINRRPLRSQRGSEGATPSASTIISVLGSVAQLGERLLCKQEVAGSTPVGSTKN